MSAFIAEARIAEAVSAATLPPETTATTDLARLERDLSGQQRPRRGRPGGLAGELRALVEEAEAVLDLLFGDEDALDPERRGRSRPRCRPRTAHRARRRSSVGWTGTLLARLQPLVQRGRAAPARRRRSAPAAAALDRGRDPEISPPPPTGTTTTSASGTSSTSSSPTVPCPAITSGSSNGWTSVRPVSSTSSASRSKASVGPGAARSTSAP